ncbi:shikimate dehydrogenase [Streptacidiphilus pinicola]|uniref:Shikimate dehydrogenase n=1 Tax=Streptacidiphilus pinicola TaxID=2219663 RepID=A0A2X0IYQ8_9ACTN|nr:shikimate dehydrogenase [Streptacidiphilus pinicola]RAG83026.1 shikimate dehydrogenase [Streptacidiphilus pinicola]
MNLEQPRPGRGVLTPERGVPVSRRAAVLGSPVRHSLCPTLHRAAYAALGLDWSYEAVECDGLGLAALLGTLDPSWGGLSLTEPLKRAALPLLDEVSDLALDVGGANTVVFRDGRSFGDNTDVAAMVAALREAGVEAPSPAVVLGGGATACSALAALRELGVRESTLVVRERGRASEADTAAGRLGVAVEVRTFRELDRLLPGTRLVISTLPAKDADRYAAAVMYSGAAVFDVAYGAWPTRLVKAAGFAGSTVVDGLALLVHQAVRQVELMTGRGDVSVEVLRAAGQAELARRAA